jgi:undecaprenyl-diphosphatase
VKGAKGVRLKLVLACLVALALAISIYARFTLMFPGDVYLTIWLQSFSSHALFLTMYYTSFIFGGWSAALLVVVIGTIVWWRVGRLEGILIPVAGLTTLTNSAFKLAIDRPRPPANLVQILAPEQGNGFPSGHAFLAILILGLAAYFISRNVKTRHARTVAITGLVALILLVGASRVYLGVHWPSDVVGGYLIGGTFLAALIWFYGSWRARRSGQAGHV